MHLMVSEMGGSLSGDSQLVDSLQEIGTVSIMELCIRVCHLCCMFSNSVTVVVC